MYDLHRLSFIKDISCLRCTKLRHLNGMVMVEKTTIDVCLRFTQRWRMSVMRRICNLIMYNITIFINSLSFENIYKAKQHMSCFSLPEHIVIMWTIRVDGSPVSVLCSSWKIWFLQLLEIYNLSPNFLKPNFTVSLDDLQVKFEYVTWS